MLLIFLDPDVGDPDVVLGSLPSFFFFLLRIAVGYLGPEMCWYTGSWGILAWDEGHLGEAPVGGSASWGKCQLGGGASWGKCQLGDFNLSDFLGTIFIHIYSCLMNATSGPYL